MKSIVVVGCVVGGAVAGYRIGLWWLDRTVQTPELESAIYPGTGTIAGAFVGLAFGLLFVAFLTRAPRRDSGSSGEDEADERGPPEPGSQRRS